MRFAIYFLPGSQTPLWRRACTWLGYDSVSGTHLDNSQSAARSSLDLDALTRVPRLYGFHATLKAPFRLGAPFEEQELLNHASSFSALTPPVGAVTLFPVLMDGFVALVAPASARPPIQELADACVRTFEPFRAPLNSLERERRLASPLSAQQIEYLDLWGYPYVFEQFRFHLTLTGPVSVSMRDRVMTTIAEEFHESDFVVEIDAICVCRQDAAGEPFRMLERFALSGPQAA